LVFLVKFERCCGLFFSVYKEMQIFKLKDTLHPNFSVKKVCTAEFLLGGDFNCEFPHGDKAKVNSLVKNEIWLDRSIN
jgi:hypothetical protein